MQHICTIRYNLLLFLESQTRQMKRPPVFPLSSPLSSLKEMVVNMYKVFIVDDEELIVKQIADTVPWMDNGFEVIGIEINP